METRLDIASPIQPHTEVVSPGVRHELVASGAVEQLSGMESIWHGRASDGSEWKIDPFFKGQLAGNVFGDVLYATVNKQVAQEFAAARTYGERAPTVERLVATGDGAIISSDCSPDIGEKLVIDRLTDAIPTSSDVEGLAIEELHRAGNTANLKGNIFFSRNDIVAFGDRTKPAGIRKQDWDDAITKYCTAQNSKSLIQIGALQLAGGVLLGRATKHLPYGRNIDGSIKEGSITFSKDYIGEVFRRADIVGQKQTVQSATINKTIDVLALWGKESVQTEQLRLEQKRANDKIFSGIDDALSAFTSVSASKVQDGSAWDVRSALQDTYLRPSEVTKVAMKTPLAKLFEQSTGVWEGYTLAEHTEAVLGMFERYYADKLPAAVVSFMRVALFMHDIGKPLATRGNYSSQAEANRSITETVMGKILGYTPEQISLVTELMGEGGKLYSDYVRFNRGEEKLKAFTSAYAERMFGKGAVGKEQAIYELMNVHYNCDAGAYTEKARYTRGNRFVRALRSLDNVFEFAPDNMGPMRHAKKMGYPKHAVSPKPASIVPTLKKASWPAPTPESRAKPRVAVEIFEKMAGVSVRSTPETRKFNLFEGKARALQGVTIAGAEHRSFHQIGKFTKEGAAKSGKFGQGTYFSLGELKGETMDGLRASDVYAHGASVTGNFMVVDRKQIKDVASLIRASAGMPEKNFKSSVRNEPDFTTLAKLISTNGNRFDGVIILMDDEGKSAELIVMPESIDKVRIDSRAYDPAQKRSTTSIS